ncbi:NAD(P)-dependent oxidoreductase [Flammeovirgaceae bacterium SG7u.111]|nr:NAD(P)-dependent oxidoreductase [Flammeovirgaceae bacterium SG7u.132]WPO33150.1 NAD(P)-dependent oxidoreductase [Flammeovirgaceae bacterium SG7u.111]
MKLGIVREGKVPIDRRVALTPEQCKEVIKKYSNVEVKVQKSPLRCFKDSEYSKAGFEIVDSVADCDIILGIKEVPVSDLLSKKTYLFFSHTIKKQPYNRHLMITILNNKVKMIDYETLTDDKGIRVIAFGRFAGLVGAYNGIIGWGKRYGLFDLKPAYQCFDMAEMKSEFAKVKLPPIKIALTGGGRVAKGAMETLEGMKIKQVSPSDFLKKEFKDAVFTQLNPGDYNEHKGGKKFEIANFFSNPQDYKSTFAPFTKVTDMLIAGAYWDPKAPVLFTKEDCKQEDFRIKLIADITCDIDGSIPSTKKASTIDTPFYDYMPEEDLITPAFSSRKNITVMAVDNLPNELPRDASQSFGEQLIENVLDNLLVKDDGMIERATIAEHGKLTDKYSYLKDYVAGLD